MTLYTRAAHPAVSANAFQQVRPFLPLLIISAILLSIFGLDVSPALVAAAGMLHLRRTWPSHDRRWLRVASFQGLALAGSMGVFLLSPSCGGGMLLGFLIMNIGATLMSSGPSQKR